MSLAVLLATAALLTGCEGSSQERQLLTTFFQAVRIRDPILLSRVSTLSLHVLAFGPVQNFTITGTSGEGRTREVTVRTPDKTLVLTLEESDLGWVVAAVK